MNNKIDLYEDFTSSRCQMKDMNIKIDLHKEFKSSKSYMNNKTNLY